MGFFVPKNAKIISDASLIYFSLNNNYTRNLCKNQHSNRDPTGILSFFMLDTLPYISNPFMKERKISYLANEIPLPSGK